jgi:crotonobetainyl-CoA:carnitine CoA-transferase CaiB-like acyl-CoA transferase
MTGSAPESALAGVRVLDLATLFPAPLLAAMLGDLGADVVKVEPAAGDPLRFVGEMHGDRSYVWALAGRNKRSVRVDFDTPEGLDLVRRLTAVADVVVVNQPPKLLARWGCSYDDIAARNPRAIVASVSGFGVDGPYAERAGNGTLAEAYAGLTHMTGEADGPPVLPSVPVGDCMGAIAGISGVLAALYWRDANGGTGQLVDVSLFESVLPFLGPLMVAWSPGEPAPTRTGSRVPGAVPRNVYATADGRWVAVSGATDAQVGRMLELIGNDTPGARARFGRSAERLAHGDELDALVAAWIAERDADAVVAQLIATRIPVAEVNDLQRLLADPHVQARRSVIEVDDPDLGTVCMPSPQPHLSATAGRIRNTGPALGAHTDEVVRDWLSSSQPDEEEHRP